MNENIDLTKILDGCPEGTKFHSALFGQVSFIKIEPYSSLPIVCKRSDDIIFRCDKGGIYIKGYAGAECIFFPSKDQRDWSKFERFWDKPKVEKFDINTLQPFDKVLVRDTDYFEWNACLFSHISSNKYAGLAMCDGAFWKQVIPYNDETKYLIGTNEDCPDYYKNWEE